MTDHPRQPDTAPAPPLLGFEWRELSLQRLVRALRSQGPGGVILRGAAGSLTIRTLGVGLAFGVHVLLARVMGAGEYGVYVYALSWVSLLVMLPVLGLDAALLRYVAAYNATAEWGPLKGILARSRRLALGLSLACGGALAALALLLQERLEPQLVRALLVAGALLPVLALTVLGQSSLRGLKRIVVSHLPETVVRPLLLAALVWGAHAVLARPVDAPAAMLFNLAAAAAGLAVCEVALRRSLPPEARAASPSYRTREWLSTSLPLLGIAATHLLLNQVDTLMLGLLQGTSNVGIYSVAARLSAFILFGMQAINSIAAPMISEYHSSKGAAELQRLLRRIAAWILCVTTPVLLFILLAGRWALGLFGDAFERAHLPLLLLSLGQLVNVCTGPCGFLLTMTGHERHNLRILWASLAVNIALNIPAIHYFGIDGVAAATGASIALRNLLVWGKARRLLGVDSSLLALFRPRR